MFALSRNQIQRRRELFLAKRRVGEYKGIILCNLRNHARDVDSFLTRTKDALDLVEFFDRRRFNRIEKHIGYIADRNSISPGGYDGSMRFCEVDLSFFKFQEDIGWYRLQYASLFVHEATHGAIEAKGIPYNKRTRLRIEQLCLEEERRFLRKASPWPEQAEERLDETWLRQYYGFWSRLRLAYRRANEILDEEQKRNS